MQELLLKMVVYVIFQRVELVVKLKEKCDYFKKTHIFLLDYQTSQLDSYMTVKSGSNVKIKRSNKDFSKYDSLDEEIKAL